MNATDVDTSHVSERKVEEFPIVDRDDTHSHSFSAISTICTSCSDYSNVSYGIEITQTFVQPIRGDTVTDCLANRAPAYTNIDGSVLVQNATDVTIGDKTCFNAPVVIKKFVVKFSEERSPMEDSQAQSKPSLIRRMLRPFNRKPILTGIVLMVLALIVTSVIVYFVYYWNITSTRSCEDIPSTPSHYSCGFATACLRCQALFSNATVCQSYYQPDCGNLRCFCEPQCRACDCRGDCGL